MGRSLAFCAIAMIAACRPAAREPPPPSNHDASPTRPRHVGDPLGLAVGATWHFRGTETTFDPASGKEVTIPTTLTTTIASVDEQDGRVVYHVIGWPGAPDPLDVVIDHGLVTIGGEPLLKLPPANGAQICDDDETRYCWTVASSGKGWDITYRTSPDVTTYHLEPGRGVTRYSYHHNGTTDDVELVRSAE